MHHSGRTFAVDLNAHSCSCHAWDLNGIPCLHACAAIMYKKEAYLRAYEPMIMPMTSQDQWMKINLPPLLPPKYHKQAGRPKKTRKQVVDEPKQPVNPYKLPRYIIPLKCGNCGEGHNRISCKSMQLRQRKQASSSQGHSQSQASEVADSSQSQPSQAVDASQSNHLKHLNVPNYLEYNNVGG
ncbi:unnamed protein product [Prunus armeniaca]